MEFESYPAALIWAAKQGKPFHLVKMAYNKIIYIENPDYAKTCI